MPAYEKVLANGEKKRAFMSKKAYEAFYKGQGYVLASDDPATLKAQADESAKSDVNAEDTSDDLQDDYSDDYDESVPLAARLGMLSYAELKERAKNLGIPKYNSIKQEELIAKIAEQEGALK